MAKVQLTKQFVVDKCLELLQLGYSRFPSGKIYEQNGGKSIYEWFQNYLVQNDGNADKFRESELKRWFKMPELKGKKTKGFGPKGASVESYNQFELVDDSATTQAGEQEVAAETPVESAPVTETVDDVIF